MAKKTKSKEKNKKKKKQNKKNENISGIKKITADDFSLSSKWKCKLTYQYHGTQNYGYQEWKFDSSPSTGSAKKNFAWSIPSGSFVKKAQVWVTLDDPYTGISVYTVNGASFTQKNGTEVGADITLVGTSGTFIAEFKFKANGSLNKDTNWHTATLNYRNVYLSIEYAGNSQQEPRTGSSKNRFEVPPQCACIYDQTSGGVYLFDGVLKIQHNISVKLEEEPEKKKDEYVNNARNEPDKVVLDVRMSDVYYGGSSTADATRLNEYQTQALNAAKKALIDSTKTRSTSIYQTLHWLKEQRRKLTLITTHYVYVEMIITSLTVNQDETSPCGWEGQITFQSAYKTKEQQKNQSSGKPTDNQPPSAALISGFIQW